MVKEGKSEEERGEKNISFTNVFRIAGAFRINPSTLFLRANL